MTKQSTMRLLVWLFAFLFIICFSIFIYARFFETPWLMYQNLPFPVPMKKVYAGEIVPMEIEKCNSFKYRKQYSISPTLIDVGNNNINVLPVTLPPIPLTIEPGCSRFITKVHLVPKDTPPGVYTFLGVSFIKGLLVTHQVEWYSERFEVIPKTEVKP